MSKRKNNKSPMVEEESDVEIITKIEYIYEDTKCITGVEPEYQWGDIYRLSRAKRCLIWAWRKKEYTPI